jgi:hypothetical protein
MRGGFNARTRIKTSTLNHELLDSVVGQENLPASGRRARRKVPPAFCEAHFVQEEPTDPYESLV